MSSSKPPRAALKTKAEAAPPAANAQQRNGAAPAASKNARFKPSGVTARGAPATTISVTAAGPTSSSSAASPTSLTQPVSVFGAMATGSKVQQQQQQQAQPAVQQQQQQQQTARIYDDMGVDVTPQPLMHAPKQHLQTVGSGGSGGSSSGKSATSTSTIGHRVSIMAADTPGNGSMFGRHGMASVMDYFNSIETQTLSHFSSLNFGKSFGNFNASRMMSGGMSMADRGDDDVTSAASGMSMDEGDRSHSTAKKANALKAAAAAAAVSPLAAATRANAPAGEGGPASPSHLANDMPSAARELSEAELNKLLHVTLSETDTVWLLDLPGTYVSADAPEATAVQEANSKYKQLLASKATNNNFVDRAAQTFNNGMKTKDIQASLVQQEDSGCNTNEWSIYDAYEELALATGDDAQLGKAAHSTEALSGGTSGTMGVSTTGLDAAAQSGNAMSGSITGAGNIVADSASLISTAVAGMGGTGQDSVGSTSMNSAAPGGGGSESASVMTTFGGNAPGAQTAEHPASSLVVMDKDAMFRNLDQVRLHESLRVMEAAVLSNTYLVRFLEYRDLFEEFKALFAKDDHPAPSKEVKRKPQSEVDAFENYIPSLQFLWSFRCDMVRDRTVTYMCWNKVNTTNGARGVQDLLAVAYGPQRESHEAPGLVCCWSLKNPEHPDRVYLSAVGHVTAIDFSRNNPSLLAVGYSDGRIAIYDVRKRDDTPILDSSSLAGKHRDPVWELKWVEREQSIGGESSQGETLVSISTDGRVCQWKIRKGLEVLDIMSLKTSMKQERDGKVKSDTKESSFISRIAGGLCFDFSRQDGSIYLAATEDGVIHRCSVAYNEQYLTSYFGHQGPVYRVKWSPFLPGAFLSCGADWTVQMWHQDRDHSLLKFNSGKDTVMDIAWSPHCATIFSCVSLDGRIEIWDLKHSVLDPAIIHSVLDQKLTATLFGETSPIVLTGDEAGNVNVYKLRRLDMMKGKPAAEQSRLLHKILLGRAQGEDDGVSALAAAGEDGMASPATGDPLAWSSAAATAANNNSSNAVSLPATNGISRSQDKSRPVTREMMR
ncbi:hypothetical protein RI367_002388 [Sorochytrium milnesiophthora]